MKKTNTPNRPLYIRIICWILIVLMVVSVAVLAVQMISAMISESKKNTKKTAELSAIYESILLESTEQAFSTETL